MSNVDFNENFMLWKYYYNFKCTIVKIAPKSIVIQCNLTENKYGEKEQMGSYSNGSGYIPASK